MPSHSMKNDNSAAALQAVLMNHVHLPGELPAIRTAYKTAKPFPHVVIDNLFSPALLERVAGEVPQMSASQWLRIETEDLQRVKRMRSALDVGSAGSELVSLLHSASFLYLLSEITDIWQLLPDPYLQGGGHALMHRGGYFQVHADRNVAYDTGLTRRLAMIIFLNKDWPPEYGGQLELWNDDATRCEASVEPVFNRTILFEVAYPNYHGVPQPLTCPSGRTRQSFIVYYHTVEVGVGDKVTPHTSMFAPQFYQQKPSLFRRAARQLTPPIIFRALRSLSGRS